MKRILFMFVFTLSVIFAVWHSFNPSQEVALKKAPVLANATVLSPSKPLINFSLIDTEGNTFTQSSLLGHWTLLFFGYSECPDICPRTLITMSELWDLLPLELQKTDLLRLLFVSLDPKSDSSVKLKTFLKRFHPSFIGLTGEIDTIQALSKACSIYSWSDPKNQPGAPKIIDHSATLLLVNPQGQIHALFSPPHQKEAIAKDLLTILKR